LYIKSQNKTRIGTKRNKKWKDGDNIIQNMTTVQCVGVLSKKMEVKLDQTWTLTHTRLRSIVVAPTP